MTWTISGDIDHGVSLTKITDDDIHVVGKVDGGSTAVLVSNRGSITIDGKVDHGSNVWLVAAGDIRIGVGKGGDNKIDGDSHVDATSGGSIALGDKIDGGHTSVDFKACGGISVGAQIDGGATVRLMAGTAPISVAGAIANSSTHVQVWPPKALTVGGGIAGDTHVDEVFWAEDEGRCRPSDLLEGYWWQNWPQTFGFVSPPRLLPRSLEDLTGFVTGEATTVGVPAPPSRALKAVGGGWSFTDAALPFATQPEVDKVSTWLRGATATQDMAKTLQGMHDATATSMDLVPELVATAVHELNRYDQDSLSRLTTSGQLLPGSDSVQLIDTRGLASSLQVQLAHILTPAAKATRSDGSMLFHVEAGITMADLQQLLDHQFPRMAIQASGGSPGATLAGTLSTATHGGEWQWPLLVDRVKAVHLVAPGGVEWWIEGDDPIADPAHLHKHYKNLDPTHQIRAGWSGIGDLTAQDVLDAVVVSMGTMGVIYSVVLEVVPQFGLQQIVVSMPWSQLLTTAQVTEDELRAGDTAANERLLDVVLDGTQNGTGIGKSENTYADLAVNPVSRDCWITNRRQVPIPADSNSPAATPDDFLKRLSASLTANAKDDFAGNKALGRVLDFLDYGTDAPNVLSHAGSTLGPLIGFLLNWPDPLVAGAAALTAQTAANIANHPGEPDRGEMFLGDVLSGFFNAMEGTAPGVVADRTDLSYRVGAIGWPDTGVPGRGLEVALDKRRAFSFLQNGLFDGVLATTMVGQSKPMLGYISLRVTPPTRRLMGMQQYADLSVMIEVVGYRSPEADVVMTAIQRTILDMNEKSRLQAMLHWGLENHLVTADDLDHTPLSQLVRSTSTFTKLDAFRAVRQYLAAGHPPVFDNNFVHRLKL